MSFQKRNLRVYQKDFENYNLIIKCSIATEHSHKKLEEVL